MKKEDIKLGVLLVSYIASDSRPQYSVVVKENVDIPKWSSHDCQHVNLYFLHSRMTKTWPIKSILKENTSSFRVFYLPSEINSCGPIAQLAEHRTLNP